MPRIACIIVPDFSIAAIVRANPALAHKVLPSAKPRAACRTDAVSTRAREVGLYPGMTIAQARSISPSSHRGQSFRSRRNFRHGALPDAAESISPLVEKGATAAHGLISRAWSASAMAEEVIAAELCEARA